MTVKLSFYKFKVQKVLVYFISVKWNYNEILFTYLQSSRMNYIFKKPRFELITFDRKSGYFISLESNTFVRFISWIFLSRSMRPQCICHLVFIPNYLEWSGIVQLTKISERDLFILLHADIIKRTVMPLYLLVYATIWREVLDRFV